MLWNKAKAFFNNSKDKGNYAEQVAAKYLNKQGLTLLENNFTCRYGEIDLIMQQNQELIFIEVKYRQSTNFGGAIMAIPSSKQKKIKKTAAFYLQQHQLNAYNTAHRFDVIALQGNINAPEITWLANAF